MTDANGDPGKEKNAGARRAWPLFVGLPLIILIAVAAVAFSGTKERASQPADGQPSGQPSGEKGSAERPSQADKGQASGGDNELGHPALGEEGAPVVMIEYGDYQ